MFKNLLLYVCYMDILIKQYKLFNHTNLMINYICKNNIMIYGKINELCVFENNLSINFDNDFKCLCFFSNEATLYLSSKNIDTENINTENIDTENQDILLNEPKYINYNELTFKYNDNNLRIPYYNNQKIFAIKINLKEIFNFVSTSSFIYDNQIICGEYIQNLADVVIGNPNSLLFNPNNKVYSKEMRTIYELRSISKYKIIFVFTHDLEDFYKKFSNYLFDKILITHNSDHGIINIKNIKIHLAQNCLINDLNIYLDSFFIPQIDINNYYSIKQKSLKESSKELLTEESSKELLKESTKELLTEESLKESLTEESKQIFKLLPLPIGIENNQWFDHFIFNEVRKMNIIKTKHIYFYFNINTHINRQYCYNKLKNKLEWNVKKEKKEYFIELAKHKYAICPRGNGLDTHRIWECLYLDVIPIMLKEDSVKINNLPIIYINKWDDIDNINFNNIEFTNQQLNKLTLNYYKNILLNFL